MNVEKMREILHKQSKIILKQKKIILKSGLIILTVAHRKIRKRPNIPKKGQISLKRYLGTLDIMNFGYLLFWFRTDQFLPLTCSP